MSSADYYLVPSTTSAKMHILTNGKASFGDASFNINGNYTLACAGPVNVQGVYSSGNLNDPSNNTYTYGQVIQIPADTSANRPPTSIAGYIRYNTGIPPDYIPDTIEYYNNQQNQYLPLYPPPLIFSVSPNTITSGNYTITGQGFGKSVTVYFIAVDGITTYSSSSVSSSISSITASAPQYFVNSSTAAKAAEPWSVRVLNNLSGLSNTCFYCIYGDLSWNSPAPGSTIPMSTSYYYNTTNTSTIFSINSPPPAVTVYFKFVTLNSGKISTYKLGIYNNPAGGNAGYLVTTSSASNPITSNIGDVPVPNGSTSVTDQFQVKVIAYNSSNNQQVTFQIFNISISPTFLPPLTITSGNATYTTYPQGGSSPSYRLYIFSPGTNTFTLPKVADPSFSQVDMLIVGGGGGGGGGYQSGGGGGGAVISTTSTLGYCGGPTYYGLSRNPTGLGPYTIYTGTNLIPSISTIYTAVVGSGGAGAYYNYNTPYSTAPTNGSPSYFKAGSTTLFQAIGGGAGAYEMNITSNAPTNSIFAQGNPGGCGGGNSHYGPQVNNTTAPLNGSISTNYSGTTDYPFFTVVPNINSDVSYNNNVATNNNINIVTINGITRIGYDIPDPSNNNGRFGYKGGSGISTNYYTASAAYPDIFLGGGGGGAGDGTYGNTGDPSANAQQYYSSPQINAFNNYNRNDPSGIAYIPPGTTSNYSNQWGIAGYGGNGIPNSITGTTITVSPGGGGGVRVGNNQQPPLSYPGSIASNGGSGQAGYGQGFSFFRNVSPGLTYSNATSNGNPGVYGAGGGGGGAATENNDYSGMTSGSGSNGIVIIRYRLS